MSKKNYKWQVNDSMFSKNVKNSQAVVVHDFSSSTREVEGSL